MKLTIKRRATAARRAELGELGEADKVEESVDVTWGTLAKVFTLLTTSTGAGSLAASGLVPLVMFACRDQEAEERARANHDRCLAVRTAAVALQAGSAGEREAGLRLLIALGGLPQSAAMAPLIENAPAPDAPAGAPSTPRFVAPHWPAEAVIALADCAAVAPARSQPSADATDGGDSRPGVCGAGRRRIASRSRWAGDSGGAAATSAAMTSA